LRERSSWLLLGAFGTVLLAKPVAAQSPPPAASARDRVHSVKALLQLARLQAGQNDSAGALESLRQARAIAPNSEDVLSAYAEASLATGATLPALATLDSLTRLYPTVASYQFEKGSALLKAGDTAAAVESLKEAERLEPNRPLTLIALGTALEDRQLYGDAKAFLLRGLSLAPDNVDATAALALADEGLGDLDAAEAHARRALGKPSPPARANLALGMVMLKREKCADARDVLLAAATADPTSARAHRELSLAYSCLDDPAASTQQLETYRQQMKEAEDRVRQLRLVTGFVEGGTQP
jgi:tetratricopeptide (TPR) repeat protein